MDPAVLKLIALHSFFIDIQPTTNIPQINLLSYTIPAQKVLSQTKVPLFVALSLKNSNMCKILLPSHMTYNHLQEILDKEQKFPEYTNLDPFLFETSYIIICNCYSSDVSNKLYRLVLDIKDIRFEKTFAGIKNTDIHSLNLNNLTLFEFNEIKPFLLLNKGMAKKIKGNISFNTEI